MYNVFISDLEKWLLSFGTKIKKYGCKLLYKYVNQNKRKAVLRVAAYFITSNAKSDMVDVKEELECHFLFKLRTKNLLQVDLLSYFKFKN